MSFLKKLYALSIVLLTIVLLVFLGLECYLIYHNLYMTDSTRQLLGSLMLVLSLVGLVDKVIYHMRYYSIENSIICLGSFMGTGMVLGLLHV